MTTPTYSEFVASLAKPGADILASLTPEKAHAWHMASCIPGEAGELYDAIMTADFENLIEELGDLEFYIEGLARPIIGYNRYEIPNKVRFGPPEHRLPGVAADVFDAVKKWVLYNEELDVEALGRAIAGLDWVMDRIRRDYGLTREQTIEHNIAKLSKRYADGYSDQAAQARADKIVPEALSGEYKGWHWNAVSGGGYTARRLYTTSMIDVCPTREELFAHIDGMDAA